jgi:hypothetical protein
MPTRSIALGEIFTTDELSRVVTMWKNNPTKWGFHRDVRDEIVVPALPRINAVLGRENDADYMAYMLEALLSHLKD